MPVTRQSGYVLTDEVEFLVENDQGLGRDHVDVEQRVCSGHGMMASCQND
jgi:hypothetical protein